MKKITRSVLLLGLMALGSNYAHAQCKSFTMKHCMPQLSPYIHNGQMNNITLFPGQNATLVQTFYSGQNYRILACNQPVLGDSVYYEVFTADDELIYTNRNDDTSYWDFNVAATQNLKINVVVPEMKSATEIEQNGCVALLIGFQD